MESALAEILGENEPTGELGGADGATGDPEPGNVQELAHQGD